MCSKWMNKGRCTEAQVPSRRCPAPPPCASTAVVPKHRAKQRVTAPPVLSHNPTMAFTPGIPPAGNHCSRVQHMRRSRGHKSSISGEAALMSPERR